MAEDTTLPTRPISSLPLSHSIKTSLTDAGYEFTSEVLQISAADLSAELGLGEIQVKDILRACSDQQSPPSPLVTNDLHAHVQPPCTQIQSSTAASLLSTDALFRFSTCIDALDDLLAHFCPAAIPQNGEASGTQDPKGKRRAGNIIAGTCIEIAGPPGIGKTSVSLGMTMDARFRACRKRKRRSSQSAAGAAGVQAGGQVLIVDTEGGIPPDRLYRLAEHVTRDTSVSGQAILDGIHLVRIPTQVQMVAFLHQLDEWLDQHPLVNLVIIDSLSYHFRQPSLDISQKRRIMDMVKQQIAKATTVHRCAIIILNQMANKSISAEGKRANFDTGDKAVLMPQLGDMWQTARTIRIALFRGQPGNEIRYAHVGTNADAEYGKWASFDVDSEGLPMDVGH